MALIICPECGKQVSDCANTCPNCGYPIHEYIIDKCSINLNKKGTII